MNWQACDAKGHGFIRAALRSLILFLPRRDWCRGCAEAPVTMRKGLLKLCFSIPINRDPFANSSPAMNNPAYALTPKCKAATPPVKFR